MSLDLTVDSPRRVHLYGRLGELFGTEYVFHVRDVGEAIRAMICQFKGDPKNGIPSFSQYISEGNFAIVRGNQVLQEEEHINIGLGDVMDIHIIPEVVGAKGGGIKVLIGVLIIVAAVVAAPFTGGTSLLASGALGPVGTTGASLGLGATAFGSVTFGQIALFGGLIAVSGLAQILAPTPEVGNTSAAEDVDERSSFLIDSLKNTSQEGAPVPLVYGKRIRVGSHVIHAGISVEDATTLALFEDDVDFTVDYTINLIEEDLNPWPYSPSPGFLDVRWDGLEARGYNRLKWTSQLAVDNWEIFPTDPEDNRPLDVDPYQIEQAIGGISPDNVYRESIIERVAEIFFNPPETTDSGDIRFNFFSFDGGVVGATPGPGMVLEITMQGQRPKEYFKSILIQNLAEDTVYFNLLSEDAIYFGTGFLFHRKFQTGNPALVVTRWAWELSSGSPPSFTIPTGADVLLKLGYDVPGS